ncbi:MAG: hypothetical protein ABWZ40_02660, partial [Caulobacterales bacterium]
MSSASSSVAFPQHRRHTRISAITGSVFLVFFLLLSAVNTGAARWACLAVAGLSAFATAMGVRQMLDQRPLLIVDNLGLTYRNFSPQRVPWSEIDAMAVVRTHRQWVRLTKSGYKHQRQADSIHFSVRDLSRYPGGAGRMIGRKMFELAKLPPIAIQTWFLEAT